MGTARETTMSAFTLEMQLPEALRELGYSDEEIRREVPILLVLKRCQEGTISTGKAARVLGISRREFLQRLASEGVPVYDPTEEELAHELKRVQRLADTTP
jgi:predicted HTH domain antitoxin